MNLQFMDVFSIADSAARLLAMERPINRGPNNSFMRGSPVAALRALWRAGDNDTRKTVVARVHLWLGHEKPRWQHAYDRIGRQIALPATDVPTP